MEEKSISPRLYVVGFITLMVAIAMFPAMMQAVHLLRFMSMTAMVKAATLQS